MAKINVPIPTSNFELIRNRLGEILADEFANQYTMSSPPNDDINPKIFIERFIPIADAELPFINISLGNGSYDNKDIKQVDGHYTFYIDCLANAPSSDDEYGDALASIKVQRLVAMTRAILENPAYKTLGYAQPFNCSVGIKAITMIEPNNNNDTTHEIQARIEYVVRIPEYVSLIDAPPISANDTQVKLYLTDKGYQWGMTGQTDYIIPEIQPGLPQVNYFIME